MDPTNKQKYIKEMKFLAFAIVLGCLMVWLSDCISPVKAQGNEDELRDTVVMGFDVSTIKKSAVESECFFNVGRWKSIDQNNLPKVPVRVTSGNVCEFNSQIIAIRKDQTEEHIRPAYAEFAFDHVNELEYIIFWFEYKTWAAREFGAQSFRRNKHDVHFVGDKMRVGAHPESKSSKVHGLKNLQFLSIITKNYSNNFKLGIVLSREPFEETYKGRKD